jgi:hypothetical protein
VRLARKHNLFSYPYGWIWFLAGLLTFGLPADLIVSSARNFWGALGGVMFVVVGIVVYKRRHDGSKDGD